MTARVNLSAYFQKIFGAEKELIWFLAHILAQKGAIKQWEFNVPLYQTIDINYSLAHTGAQSCCAPKCLAQSSKEIHPGVTGQSEKSANLIRLQNFGTYDFLKLTIMWKECVFSVVS